MMTTETKTCTGCHETLPATVAAFGSNQSRADGLGFYCRDCQRKANERSHEKKHKYKPGSPSAHFKRIMTRLGIDADREREATTIFDRRKKLGAVPANLQARYGINADGAPV